MTGVMIHPKVAEEMANAAKWYRDIDPELGDFRTANGREGMRIKILLNEIPDSEYSVLNIRVDWRPFAVKHLSMTA